MNRAVIALGSNIDAPRHIAAAMHRLAAEHAVLASSPVVSTAPVGYADQPDFLNTAALIETAMSRPQLKEWLTRVETDLGRVRTPNRYGPRTIDLDIVVFNGEVVDEDVLTRDYLRQAVRELCPELTVLAPPAAQ